VKAAGIYALVTMVRCTALSVFQNHMAKMNKDEHFMQLALKEAEHAFDKGEVPVGAVLVIDGKIIASAHNNKETSGDPTAHAELRVLREGAVKTGERRLNEAILYVTKEPCVMCAGAIINSRLGRLVYGCKDERFGAVNSRYQLLHDPALNHQVRVVAGVLEEQCAGILKKFFELRR
jgi:tRNA(adenine34) deaminase